MNAKRFGHFLSYWRQMAQAKNQKPAPKDRRVTLAKAALRTALAAR